MADQDQCTSIDALLGKPPQEQTSYRDPMPQMNRVPPSPPQRAMQTAVPDQSFVAPAEGFMPGYPMFKTLGIDEKMAKGLIIAVVILTIVQQDQARNFIVASLPMLLKNGPVLRSVSVSIVVVALTFVGIKVFG